MIKIMRCYLKSILVLAGVLALPSAPLDVGAQTAGSNASAPAPSIKYRPPTTGAASVRVSGGSRGTGYRPATTTAASVRVTGGSRGAHVEPIVLETLVPNEVGTTTQEQPSLFWYQSIPSDAKFELTLLEEKNVKPLVQITSERASKAGIQRLKLSEHGAKLVRGVEYQWVVALILDPENRSTDLVASGVIRRVDPGAELNEKVQKSSPSSLAAVYAEAGIWYDALSALSDEIQAQPDNQNLRTARNDLLSQVGLKATDLVAKN